MNEWTGKIEKAEKKRHGFNIGKEAIDSFAADSIAD